MCNDGLIIAVVLLVMVFVLLTTMLDSRPEKPEVVVLQVRSKPMADVLTYRVSAPAPTDADVVSRRLTVTVNGKETVSTSFDGATTDLGTFDVPQDSVVDLSLVDVDDSGNKSEPAVFSFVAVDTVAPSQPGALGVTLEGEKSAES